MFLKDSLLVNLQSLYLFSVFVSTHMFMKTGAEIRNSLPVSENACHIYLFFVRKSIYTLTP